MFPLNLPGPEFLLFYFIVAVIANVWILRYFRQREALEPRPRITASYPYKIAFLRGGENEAIKIATFSLMDRGLLLVEETSEGLFPTKKQMLVTKNPEAVQLVQRPLERAILEKCKTHTEISDIFTDPRVLAACEEFGNELTTLKLLADDWVYEERLGFPLFVAGFFVVGLPLIKLLLAFFRGHSNVMFLIAMTFVASLILFNIYKDRKTGLGAAFLEDQKTLFGSLKRRADYLVPGGATNEAAILAAVFGLNVLPGTAFPFLKKLYPRKSDNSICGSSCGSSSSSCSGGCGGGGCGGCGG